MKPLTDARVTAVKILTQVLQHKQSLNKAILINEQSAEKVKSLVQELCFGTLRWHLRLKAITEKLLKKSLKTKDTDVLVLILIGLYQLIYMRTPAHAAISETVNAAKKIQKNWACGLVNGTLRSFQRQENELLQTIEKDPEALFAHPAWLIELFKRTYPDDWQALLTINNSHPPMSLRVNQQQLSREDYVKRLQKKEILSYVSTFAPQGITLEKPYPVDKLPGFKKGLVSVQDPAAQLAAELLELTPEQTVLDACAAPGGKTSHILEKQPNLTKLVAVEKDESRLNKIRENLQRLNLNAEIVLGDASKPEKWAKDTLFDRILLDAPCSATGVIRRHPDIKFLLTQEDIAQLAKQQLLLLNALWPLLKPNGLLVYATCSLLFEENSQMLTTFLSAQNNALEKKIEAEWGVAQPIGRALLPHVDNTDGFYYAKLVKTP